MIRAWPDRTKQHRTLHDERQTGTFARLDWPRGIARGPGERMDRHRALRDGLGREQPRGDGVTAWPAIGFCPTLDRRDPEPQPGDALPPGWHWLYFLEAKPASELGPDGHPKRGGFLPPVDWPRRMWAGGRIEFREPLRVGDEIRRDSRILSIEPKQGRSGSLVFVTVRHSVSTG